MRKTKLKENPEMTGVNWWGAGTRQQSEIGQMKKKRVELGGGGGAMATVIQTGRRITVNIWAPPRSDGRGDAAPQNRTCMAGSRGTVITPAGRDGPSAGQPQKKSRIKSKFKTDNRKITKASRIEPRIRKKSKPWSLIPFRCSRSRSSSTTSR
jgi:hypothetical protein